MMRRITLLTISCSLLAVAVAAASDCGRTVGSVAIRLNPVRPGDALSATSELPLQLGGQKLEAKSRQNLPGFWIYTAAGFFDPNEFRSLSPVAGCRKFRLTSGPNVDRLRDGLCYAIFDFSIESTCWTLRVSSSPKGYPFQVLVGQKITSSPPRTLSGNDLDWNLERDLPRVVATVEIYERDNPKRCLLKIPEVTYVNVVTDDSWKLLKHEALAKFVELEEGLHGKETSPSAETLREELRKRRMETDPALKGLLWIKFESEQ
jgi:hypothetical protein